MLEHINLKVLYCVFFELRTGICDDFNCVLVVSLGPDNNYIQMSIIIDIKQKNIVNIEPGALEYVYDLQFFKFTIVFVENISNY